MDNQVEVKCRYLKTSGRFTWEFKYTEDGTIFKWKFENCTLAPTPANHEKNIEIANGLKAFAKKMLGKSIRS